MNQQIRTTIDLQLENRNRVSTFFRLILVIPVAIYANAFGDYYNTDNYLSAGIFVLPVILTLLFVGTYPSYVFSFNKSILALGVRISAYVFLLTDEYPSIEANEKFNVEFPEIDGGKSLSRGLPLVKWLLAIPLYFVGAVYAIYALMLTIVAWITIVFTGEYPEWCAAGVIGTIGYWNRVAGYAFVLVTDEYPSFSL
ncbi:MAG TPA: DUF4389 domain-containing protein [Candidatus Paceibacterota bacterium]|nr:DUF4389 domain-containing protein [Candidatus Paceibacterota bacterium]